MAPDIVDLIDNVVEAHRLGDEMRWAPGWTDTPPTVQCGDQEPRLLLKPPEVYNAGDEAIELYHNCGEILDPWQQLCIRLGCGLREDLSPAAFEVGLIVSRQNGKGACIEAICLASLFLWGNRITVYSAHRGDTVEATFKRIKTLIEANDELLRRCKPIHESDLYIELIGGAQIQFKTRGRSGGRGLTGDLVILDEALELNPVQMASLIPILLARPYAQVWYASTVPTSGDQHLVDVRARVLDGVERTAWAEWGNDKGADPRDPVALARANPALGYRLTLERLGDLLRTLGETLFRTECMGIWPNQTKGSVLDPALWTAMTDPDSHRIPGSDLVLSLDATPMLTHGSIGMHAWRPDGLEHTQLVDYAPGIDWLVERAAILNAALRPALWVVDRKNGAYALRAALAAVGIKEAEDPRKLRRGELLVLDAAEAADATMQWLDAFLRRKFRHIDQEPLNLATRNAKARPIGDAGQVAWGRRLSDVDIGPLIVVTQARYGSHVWADPARRAPSKTRARVW